MPVRAAGPPAGVQRGRVVPAVHALETGAVTPEQGLAFAAPLPGDVLTGLGPLHDHVLFDRGIRALDGEDTLGVGPAAAADIGLVIQGPPTGATAIIDLEGAVHATRQLAVEAAPLHGDVAARRGAVAAVEGAGVAALAGATDAVPAGGRCAAAAALVGAPQRAHGIPLRRTAEGIHCADAGLAVAAPATRRV